MKDNEILLPDLPGPALAVTLMYQYRLSQSARRILIAAIIAFAAFQSAFLIWFITRRLPIPVQLGPNLYQPMAALCLVLFNTLVAIWFFLRWKGSHLVIDFAAGTVVLPTGRGFSLAHLYRLPVVGALYVVVHTPHDGWRRRISTTTTIVAPFLFERPEQLSDDLQQLNPAHFTE